MEIEDKIYKSESFSSLLFEKKVEQLCLKNKWAVTHSAYYSDPTTNKLREIDVVARQAWKKKQKGISIDNFLVIECKSNPNYSVLLTESFSKSPIYVRGNSFWLGDEQYNRYARLRNILINEQIPINEIETIIKELELLTFPNEISLLRNYYPKLNKIVEYNSFKETNTQQTRDAETSVVWKASQSLNSCIEGFFKTRWEVIESNIITGIDFSKKTNIVESVMDSVNFFIQHLVLIHPLLVIDSSLLTIKNNKPVKIKHGRLVKLNMYGHCESWIDIVNSEFVEEYINSLNIFYSSFFRKRRMAKQK